VANQVGSLLKQPTYSITDPTVSSEDGNVFAVQETWLRDIEYWLKIVKFILVTRTEVGMAMLMISFLKELKIVFDMG
jgi:hypothetical protein